MNKFFLFFSWIGNWVLNLFDANHYQIIDAERYRAEDQFYAKPSQKDKEDKENKEESVSTTETPTGNNEVTPVNNWDSTAEMLNIQNHEINNETVDVKTLDNDQQISINNQDNWIDLSDHEINNSEEFKLDL